MTPDRWQQVKELFNSALEREPGHRSTFLAEACRGDEYLRSEVESLLSSHERDGQFIDAPAFELAADLFTNKQSTMASGPPDGRRIYYLGAAPGLSKLQLAPSDEPIGEPANVSGPGPGTALRNPAISADGKKIVYSASRTSSNLWSVSLSPASADALGSPSPFSRDTSQRNNLARFSPDGRKLALTRWRPGTSADIWVADADGRNLTQVTNNPATDSQASWFPQSDKLAFLSDRDKPMKPTNSFSLSLRCVTASPMKLTLATTSYKAYRTLASSLFARQP